MRWFWIDRFTEFVAGTSAKAVKGISLTEEVVDDYAPGAPYLPASLIIEGMAQTGGLLVSQMSDFKARVVLAKLSVARFHQQARPGTLLHFACEMKTSTADSAMVTGTVENELGPVAELEMMFAMLQDDRFENVVLFEPAALCRMVRMMRLFEVGRYPDGTPIRVPEHMLEAERSELNVY